MSKYTPLMTYLQASGQEDVFMTFDEIERVIEAELPASAFKHRAWWSNNPSSSVISYAWLQAGYKATKVDMPGRKLVFYKSPDAQRLEAKYKVFEELKLRVIGNEQPGEAEAFEDASPFSRIYGALKGTVTVMPGTDLAALVSAEWDAAR